MTSFQSRVQPWMLECFGAQIAADCAGRNHRFLEEALELVQALGCPKEAALQLVDYVYGRAVGDPPQEVGGVMVTLAALCLANSLDMHDAGEQELARVWTKIEQIRAKQANKPKCSPLPSSDPDAYPKSGLAIDELIESYVDGYELIGEDDEGREGHYAPNDLEDMLIRDAMRGLVADEDFVTLMGQHFNERQKRRAAEGCCLACGAPNGSHWGTRPECKEVAV